MSDNLTKSLPFCVCGFKQIASCDEDGRDGHGVAGCMWWWCPNHGLVPADEVDARITDDDIVHRCQICSSLVTSRKAVEA